jgi:hypothetical protein
MTTSLIQDVQAVLNTLQLAGGSWYAINETQQPVYPFAVFLFVVSTSNNTLQGPSDQQNTRVQIDLFARTPADLDAASKALDTAMQAASFTNLPISSQDLYEEPVRAYRRVREFSVWSTN